MFQAVDRSTENRADNRDDRRKVLRFDANSGEILRFSFMFFYLFRNILFSSSAQTKITPN